MRKKTSATPQIATHIVLNEINMASHIEPSVGSNPELSNHLASPAPWRSLIVVRVKGSRVCSSGKNSLQPILVPRFSTRENSFSLLLTTVKPRAKA